MGTTIEEDKSAQLLEDQTCLPRPPLSDFLGPQLFSL